MSRAHACPWLFLTLLGLATPVMAGDGPVVAMFEMEDRGTKLGDQVFENLLDYLAARLTEGGFQVVPPDQIRQRIKQQKAKSHQSCIDQSCQIEMGREVAAQKTFTTKILRIGNTCQITAVMYDLRKAATEMAATAGAKCNVDSLLTAVNQIAEKLCEPLKKSRQEADAGLARFEKIRQSAENEKAEVDRMKKAWEIVSKIARDETLPKKMRVQALNDFMGEFRQQSSFVSDARALMSALDVGELVVKTEPAGAEVLIAGQTAGKAPVRQKLDEGSYAIEARLDGYKVARNRAVIGGGKQVEVLLRLEQKEEPVPEPVAAPERVAVAEPVKAPERVKAPEPVKAPEKVKAPEREVAALEAMADRAPPPPPRSNVEAAAPSRPMPMLTLVGHITFWSGLGLCALGGAATGLALSAASNYENGDLSAKNAAKTWTGVMYAGFGVGAAAMITGAVLWFLPDSGPGLSAAVTPADDGAVFSLGGRF